MLIWYKGSIIYLHTSKEWNLINLKLLFLISTKRNIGMRSTSRILLNLSLKMDTTRLTKLLTVSWEKVMILTRSRITWRKGMIRIWLFLMESSNTSECGQLKSKLSDLFIRGNSMWCSREKSRKHWQECSTSQEELVNIGQDGEPKMSTSMKSWRKSRGEICWIVSESFLVFWKNTTEIFETTAQIFKNWKR